MATAAIQNVTYRLPTAAGSLQLPDGVLESDHFSSTSGKELAAAKQNHLHKRGTGFALAIGGTPATREEVVFVASTSGTINKFAAKLTLDGTTTDIDFDLKKNGTTVLSAAVNLTHSTGDGVVVEGTISSASFSVGDSFSIAMTVTSATGAQGPWSWAEFIETLG